VYPRARMASAHPACLWPLLGEWHGHPARGSLRAPLCLHPLHGRMPVPRCRLSRLKRVRKFREPASGCHLLLPLRRARVCDVNRPSAIFRRTCSAVYGPLFNPNLPAMVYTES